MVVSGILAALAILTVGLILWQWRVALRFPLHRRLSPTLPGNQGVTILKPLKGCDAETASCLRSWLDQEYTGPVQILFGVADKEDQVCQVIQNLLDARNRISEPRQQALNQPGKATPEAQLVVCPDQLGANAKVSTLVQLERLARHEIIIISDADVRVPPDLLTQLVARLQEDSAGMVHCFYRLANPANFAMRLEAFAINADFWSQVLQAESLSGIDFALGAVMATTRQRLAQIGGFSSVADYLADDYQLGHRIAVTGARIVLCPVVVECWTAPMGWREVWSHQLRWARTIRVCRPGSYFLSILSNGTLWPLLWWLSRPTATVLAAACGCWLVRMASAFWLERKFTGRGDWKSLWLAPLKDLGQALIWLLAFAGNRVHWRGKTYAVARVGKLVLS